MDNQSFTNTEQKTLSVNFQYLRKLNYSIYQNERKIILSFEVENKTNEDITDAEASISSADPFMNPVIMPIQILPKQNKVDLSSIAIEIEPNYIVQLTERINPHCS